MQLENVRVKALAARPATGDLKPQSLQSGLCRKRALLGLSHAMLQSDIKRTERLQMHLIPTGDPAVSTLQAGRLAPARTDARQACEVGTVA